MLVGIHDAGDVDLVVAGVRMKDVTTSSSTSRSACTSPGEDTNTRMMRTVSGMVAVLGLRG
ncbi:MAG: hypothetical protein GXY83_00965 [Rhodopirellula sp.]|nr:hypothetical protein [Rhodopirellula sp.]